MAPGPRPGVPGLGRRPSARRPNASKLRPHVRVRCLRAALALLLPLLLGVASAHAFLVLGEFTVEPDPPTPDAPLTVIITMADPSLAPVEDAVVFIEVRRIADVPDDIPAASTDEPDLPPPDVRVDLIERSPGRYEGELVAPSAGSYHVLIRDQTFQWEEANASIMLDLGGQAVGTVPFILPPTAVGPRSLWIWLLWLVGVPLVVGVVVTALVLGNRRPAAGPEEGSEASA